MAGERERISAMLDSIVANAQTAKKDLAALSGTDVTGGVVVDPVKNVFNVKVGESVQRAFDALLPTGGVIKLAPGVHPNDLVFSERPRDAKLITFTSDSENLPADGKRMNPDYRPALGILQGVSAAVSPLRVLNKCRNVAFVNVGFGPPVTKSYTHIDIGGDKRSMPTPADRPDGFLFDRVYVFGDPTLGAHRGISLNGSHIQVRNSYFEDIFEPGRDSQAVGAWNGASYILLENSYFEGGAENVMFGGSDSASAEMICSDILIKGCHLAKNFDWSTLASVPSIKCLFETKSVRRLMMDSCLLENNWARDWPSGVAISLKACNGSFSETWATSEDVTLQNLVIRNVGSVFSNIGKNDSGRVSDWMRRIKISNLLAYNINVGTWKGTGRGMPLANGVDEYIDIDHVTFHTNGHSWMNMWFDSGIMKSPGKFRLTNSLLAEGEYGYHSSSGIGFAAIEKDWTGTEIAGNVFRTGARSQGTLPPDNLRLAASVWDQSFAPDHGVFGTSEAAKVKTTDGKLPGADVRALRDRIVY